MPHTVNGIGTWYYGKKDRMRRTGMCEFCKRITTLQSYQTREFIVVLFIPIIPLRRFKILNDCAVCRQHRRIPFAKFEEMYRADVEQAKAAVAANPNDIDALERLCGTMLAWHQPEGAVRAFQVLVEKCPDRATAHFGLASALNGLGRTGEAQAAFEQALRIDPKLVEAIVEYSNMLWGAKRKKESLDMLRSRAQANWDSTRFVSTYGDLANWTKDWATAAQAYGRLLELAPQLHQDKAFAKLARKMHKKARMPFPEPAG